MKTPTKTNQILFPTKQRKNRRFAGILAANLLLSASLSYATSPDGLTWESQNSGTTNLLHSVSVADNSFVVATGNNGTVLLYNGTTWNPFPGFSEFAANDTGWNSASDIRSSVAIGNSTVYIGSYDSENGKVAYWNGSQWQTIGTGTARRITALWAGGSDLVLAGRISGYMARFTDGTFKGHPINGNFGSFTIHTIAGSGSDNIWATGPNGFLLRSVDAGSTWTQLSTPSSEAILPLFSLSSTQNWFKSGGDLYFYDGEEFSLQHTFETTVMDLYALSEDQIWVVGSSGLAAFYNGTDWAELDLGATSWRSIDGVGTDIWLVGNNGQIFKASIPEPAGFITSLTGGLVLLIGIQRMSRKKTTLGCAD